MAAIEKLSGENRRQREEAKAAMAKICGGKHRENRKSAVKRLKGGGEKLNQAAAASKYQ
jgi:hypothetical protein